MIGLAKTTEKASLIKRLDAARRCTDKLFEIVRTDALYDRPIAERHRLIFYVGHLEAFDWNLFRHHLPNLQSPQPAFDQLFAFGIDPVDGGLPSDRAEDLPSVSEVRSYNESTRRQIDAVLESGDLELNGNSPGLEWTLLHVAIEHRLMHAETLAYLFHRLPYEKKVAQKQSGVAANACPPEIVSIPSGTATLGLSKKPDQAFGWDNEFESQTLDVPEFLIDKFMVSNGEFLKFVEAGGYDDLKLWKPADWQWIQAQQIRQPAFWQRQGNDWTWRGMFEEFALPLDWPVYVSHAEASAYARWVGKALPTEAQWHRAAYGTPSGAENEYPWGNDKQIEDRGNFDFVRWDPAPVNAAKENLSAFGATGMLGNGWEWSASEFAPFPGFTPFPFYAGYSANFFDGQHFVLKGGSARTAAPLLRRSFRNWFQPHYQYAYTGFRCVSNPENGGKTC
ncbi:MAG: SUMF1/EgtB/PvdO family nonheme iron enzyme [Candidatus Acidiferrum sp.]